MDNRELLTAFCEASGAPGYETDRAELVTREFSPYCKDVRRDNLGSVIGFRQGGGQGRIMLCAHMDEISLMVSAIDKEGFLGLSALGFFDARMLYAQEVTVHGREKVFGVIGAPPPVVSHEAPTPLKPGDKREAPKLDALFVDTGFRVEKVHELVRIGDIVTINRKTTGLLNDRLAGKALDDSAGLVSLVIALRLLRDIRLDADLYLVASSQEEVGSRGALTAAYAIEPDIAVAVDVGFARTPGLKDEDTSEIGKGPDISCGPNISRRVYERLRDTARQNNIPTQYSVIPGGYSGTDAYSMQTARDGVATGCVSIPLKYMHTSVEVVSLRDIAETGRLLACFVQSFNGSGLEECICL